MMHRIRVASFWLLLASLATLGCSRAAQHYRPAIDTQYVVPEAGLSKENQARVDHNCYNGMPVKISKLLGPTEYVFRDGYVLEHSSVDKIPLWVCEGVTAKQLQGSAGRANKFLSDSLLKGPKALPADYARSGYDKGHQAPAGNQNADQRLKNETFYLSNMAPQLPALNRNAWKVLEEKTREWVDRYGFAYELTGPIFYDPKEDQPSTANGVVDYRTIGKDKVAVPTHFYKIIVAKDEKGEWRSIAFVMPNAGIKPPYHLENYIVAVKWIQQKTGLNFMPDLSAAEAKKLESDKSRMW